MGGSLQIRFWGTRGSCAAPFSNRMEYGGNTSCVSVQWDRGLAVFDGGTGMAALSKSLEAYGKEGRPPVFVFVSHMHLDHIIGIPLFSMLFRREAVIHLYGPGGDGISFRERVSRVLGPPYWPVAVDQAPARLVWHDAGEETQWELPGGVRVLAMRSNHPNGGFVYRLEYDGQSVVYGLDCELGQEVKEGWKPGLGNGFPEQYRNFARDCSLLIFDAPYAEDNYLCHKGFGHSFWQQGLWMAQSCNAGRLMICHHDWDKTDEQLMEREKKLQKLAEPWGRPVEFAREGAAICLEGGKERNL